MSNLPASLRNGLSRDWALKTLEIEKKEKSGLDGTTKFIFKTSDSRSFSAVFLPHSKYNSLCISTQVGCAWGCRFCASGLVPFTRDLTPGEILDQIFLCEEESGQKIKNILFMGMGEPLANYSGTLKSIQWFTSPNGFRMNPSRIVVSTTGLAPQIAKIAGENLRVNLALSLHAPTDDLRKKLMPKSARFPIRDVLAACKIYQEKNRSEFTIEYILLKNINDTLEVARNLAELILSSRFPFQPKINLIPHNPVPSIPYETPAPETVRSFFDFLKSKKLNVHTRKPQGRDLSAACGQLL